ncbi:MAG TPA: hypothetical protein DEA22_02190 [Blastocatellia bacterium]|nr:hypothetical protein [Blastocatellia bacterium]
MIHDFQAGDFLVFQIESGFGLLRVLKVEFDDPEYVWHILLYRDLFPDIDSIEESLSNPGGLTIEIPHIALTNRAFESTQLSKFGNLPLNNDEIAVLEQIGNSDEFEILDRSIRLILGIR